MQAFVNNLLDPEKLKTAMSKVSAVVNNYSEYEHKVREATNQDKWGTSSTQMQDIANATYNFNHFNDIMNTLFSRLQLPEGSQWRQTYKALQLLEFLIKNGSEQVIDAARRRIYEIKARENYSYIDENRKDQGVNIKHRAKEIVALLADDERIRLERQKAKDNKAKYGGIGSDASYAGFGSSSVSSSSKFQISHLGRYGGFGSDSQSNAGASRYGGFGSDSYATGPASYNDQARDYRNDNRLNQPEKSTVAEVVKSAPVEKKAAPVVANLLDFDMPAPASSGAVSSGDNEWADFASATPVPSTKQTSGMDFANFGSVPPSVQQNSMNVSSAVPQQQSFAAFGGSGSTAAGSMNGFASFGNSGSPVKGFANFQQPVASQPASDFAAFQQTAPRTQVNDPFSSLVSLDPSALATPRKKQPETGPSLNALGSNGITFNY